MKLIILAAGQGTRLRPITDDRPKVLVEVGGTPILDRQLAAASAAGIKDVVVVGGYRADRLADYAVELVVNERFATTNMVQSLMCAEDHFGDDFIMSYGDIVYGPQVLEALLASTAPVSVVVDRQWRDYWGERFDDPLSDAESLFIGARGTITEIGQKENDINRIQAQYIGLVRFRVEGVTALRETVERAGREGLRRPGSDALLPLDGLFMTDVLQEIARAHDCLCPVPIDGGWAEVDSPRDLEIAGQRFGTREERAPW